VPGRIVRVPDHCNPGDPRNRSFQELEPFAADLWTEKTEAGDIAAGLGETGNKTEAKRFARAPIFDEQVLSLDITEIAQPLAERILKYLAVP
jgi:hypothetical protein